MATGKNLYMVWTVVQVLLAITPVVLSGYVVYQEWTGEWMEDIHEFFGNFLLIAVLAHHGGWSLAHGPCITSSLVG